MNECSTCFDSVLSNCPTGITLNAHLTPLTDYKWVITDKFGNKYTDTVTSDADGAIIIDDAALPDGFFSAHAGEFSIQVLNPLTNTPQSMKLCQYFDCINVSIVGGNDTEDTIGLA